MQKSKEQGGLSLAANILSNMLDLTYDAIVKAEENKVKVAMFDLLSANETWCNENRVPVPVRVWYEKDADGKPVRRTTEPSRSEREEMKKYKGELLVMAGDADFLVPMPHCEEVAATNDKAELIIYEGADHNFNVMTDDKSISEDLIQTTAQWLADHL